MFTTLALAAIIVTNPASCPPSAPWVEPAGEAGYQCVALSPDQAIEAWIATHNPDYDAAHPAAAPAPKHHAAAHHRHHAPKHHRHAPKHRARKAAHR